MVGTLVAVVLLGVANLPPSGHRPAGDDWPETARGDPPAGGRCGGRRLRFPRAAGPAIDWAEQLAPRGSETRLGDALHYVVDKERGGPIAGVIVFTDGGSNAGIDTTEAVAAAADANLAVFPVGFGSASRPTNVAIVDMEAPARVYPGDRFGLTGYLQAHGLTDKTVEVELVTSAADAGAAAEEHVEESRRSCAWAPTARSSN